MKRSAFTLLLTTLASVPLINTAQAQIPVIDASRLALAVRDYVTQQIPQMLTSKAAAMRAFSHYRRITQHAGVTVFLSGAAREALAPPSPAAPTSPYSAIYAHEYAHGIPEAEQDRAAQARMDALGFHHLTELDSIKLAMAHLHGQLIELNEELSTTLRRPPAAAGDTTSNVHGELAQLEAAIQVKTSRVMALHARATALQGRQAMARTLYAGQRSARAQVTFSRGAREIAGPPLATPFVPEPRYDGIRQFLRFPGLREQAEGN